MTPQTPPVELLARQNADYRGWLWVAPPRDGWLASGEGAVLSADFDIVSAWQRADRGVFSPLDATPIAVAGAVLFWPKSHALGEWWLRSLNARLAPGTPIQIVGENQGGIKRLPKVLAGLDQAYRKLDTARRCALFETEASGVSLAPDAGWTQFEAEGLALASHPGVFGHGKLDAGTRLLLETLAVESSTGESERVLDVGCGDGIVAAWMARRGNAVTATDINAFAVAAARRTLALNHFEGRVVQGDVYSEVSGQFEAIVSNPPFHQERTIDYGPAQRLILEAPDHLLPGGTLTLVANAFLPYPDWLSSAFGEFETLADDRRFRVYRATKGRR
ncbi:class I SAM-dependent methyltransferase [Salinicola halophilus]|uniref:class I SAM-dependent methyltransferase n=1 Tax=Salinicola halophilus TaxID=184065 RepID=UPI000DA15D83|nr:class I SAM-dependent methyltransferase [Salinicola halophilus]